MVYLLFILLISSVYSLHLTKQNYYSITQLLQNKHLTVEQRNKLNRVMYNCYEKWAIKRAVLFKDKHKYKCSRIPLNELILYSKVGLHKATLNYNGRSNFTNYSAFYVDGQIRQALTDSYSLSILPKKLRKMSKKNMNSSEIKNYKELLEMKTFTNIEHWSKNSNKHILDHYNDLEDYRVVWDKINKLDPFTKRVVFLKFDYRFNKVRTNKHVAQLMCCSEEYIRITLKKLNYFSK